jgi:hypothetical protein
MSGTRVSADSREERLKVFRPSGEFCYTAPVSVVKEMIRNGQARGNGSRNALLSCTLYEGPVRWSAGTTYVHNRDVAETWTDMDGVVHQRHWMDGNVRGAYTLKRLSHLDRDIFREVERSCLKASPAVPPKNG